MDEASIRVSIFLIMILILGIAQWRWPRRQLKHSLFSRWLTNFSIVALGSFTVRLLPAFILPVSVAGWAASEQTGLLNLLALPWWLSLILSIVILDGVIYWQHRIFHRVPLLWKLHRVHHYDPDYDLSTALRFHPIEIFLSVLIKNLAILIIGAPVLAVILFEVILNSMALFNHSNLAIPRKTDQVLRKFIVTPDMHRVHHSTDIQEMHHNFGFNLSIWDRWFNSYIPQPSLGHEKMHIGQPDSQHLPVNRLLWILGAALKQPVERKHQT